MKMRMTKHCHDDHNLTNGNLVIRTTHKSNDSLAKLTNLVDKSDDNIAELEQTTTHMAKMKDEREDGDNGIWMNE